MNSIRARLLVLLVAEMLRVARVAEVAAAKPTTRHRTDRP